MLSLRYPIYQFTNLSYYPIQPICRSNLGRALLSRVCRFLISKNKEHIFDVTTSNGFILYQHIVLDEMSEDMTIRLKILETDVDQALAQTRSGRSCIRGQKGAAVKDELAPRPKGSNTTVYDFLLVLPWPRKFEKHSHARIGPFDRKRNRSLAVKKRAQIDISVDHRRIAHQ